ncbi:hypothetical protein, partial [Microcystis sp. M155S2]|uniref:hypothetical protein n=1 Tax=Microcystis sp. M155S2 TaxID=2771151 RepID=UPI00258CC2DB
ELRLGTFSIYMAIILANGENSCPLRNVTNYMGTLRKVKGVYPLMDKGALMVSVWKRNLYK